MQFTGFISVSAFASLLGISIEIKIYAIGSKIYAIAAGIQKYKLIIKKKKKNHGETVLLAKSKLNSIEVLISKAVSNSNISHDEFVLIKIVLKRIGDINTSIRIS